MNKYELVKNKYGYYEVKNKPDIKELADYYSKKYYQDGEGSYNSGNAYSEDEIKYFLNKVDSKYYAASEVSSGALTNGKTFLDIGAGEGWALKYFTDKGWDCIGLDFSEHGCSQNNPDQIKNLLVGDIEMNLSSLYKEDKKFDFILIDNVLEHVRDPLKALSDIKSIISDDGVLVVEVPNDFSVAQEHLYDEGYVSSKFWLAFPDHLSYFNKSGLKCLAESAGWSVGKTLTAYPIDFNLFNVNTNYIETRDVGKSCHHSRVAIENLFHSISVEKANKLYEAMADLGVGRDIVMIMTK